MALAVLGAVPAGAAAAGWVLPATPLAPQADGPSGAVVAVAPGGDAVAAWTGFDGVDEQTLLVATRPAGGPWSAPQTLAENAGVDAPAVAIDATGDATVLWVESADGLAYAARAARRPAAGGSWSAPHDFPPAGSAQPLTQLRAGAGGDVVAAWVEYDAGDAVYVVRGAVWSGGAWGPPATLSDAGQVSVSYGRPQIAPDAAGGPLVAWTAQQLADPWLYAIQTSSLVGGAWSAPLDVETSADSLSPVRLVGVDGGGAAASWFAGSPATLWGALRAGGEPWTVDDVSADVAPACEPLLALGADDDDGATVVWRAQSTDGLESVRLTAGGWEPAQTVFAARSEVAHDAAIERGTVVFVAADVGTNAYSLLAARPSAGGGWTAPALLTGAPAGGDLAQPELAADASGNVLAAWTATDGLGGKSVAAAGFQASGPQLSAVSVPASGTVGEALAVSAVARSAFASVAQVTWDFGDGSPLAPGAAAAHAYAQPGTYTVTVTAVDGLGNASAARRTVTIAPAAVPPADPPADLPGDGGDPPAGGGDPPGGGNGDPAPPPALARPALAVRGGVLRLPRRSRSVRLAARNRDAVALRGVAQLVRPRSGRRAALTLARMRGLVLASEGRRAVVRLRLSTAALRELRRAPRQRLRVRVVLRLRAADGRRVAVARTVTLDASARFAPARRPAAARIAC